MGSVCSKGCLVHVHGVYLGPESLMKRDVIHPTQVVRRKPRTRREGGIPPHAFQSHYICDPYDEI